MAKRTRPVLHSQPVIGEIYRWEGNGVQFLVLGVETHREIWLCRAVDLQNGVETEIGIRSRDRFNGWTRVENFSSFSV
jgi:hypothetical protein